MRHTAVLRAPVHLHLAPSSRLLVFSGLVASLILTACAPSAKTATKTSPTPTATPTVAGTPSPSPIPTFAATGPMPAISGRLYLATFGQSPYDRIGQALDPATGEAQWSVSLANGGGPTAFANGRVFALGGAGAGLKALDPATGAVQWSSAAPADNFIVGNNGMLYATVAGATNYGISAIDDQTGAIRWTWHPVETGMDPEALTLSGTTLIVAGKERGDGAPGFNGLYGLNATTGAVRWANPHGYVYFGSEIIAQGGALYYVADTAMPGGKSVVAAASVETNALLWTRDASSPISGGNVQFADAHAIYLDAGDSNLVALNLANGAQLWTHTGKPHAHYSVAGTTIFETAYDAGFTLTALDAATGTARWSQPVTATNAPGLVGASDGLVYFAALGPDVLYALDTTTGAVKWRFPIGCDRALLSNGVLFVYRAELNASSYGPDPLYALDAKTGGVFWHRDLPYAVLGTLFIGG